MIRKETIHPEGDSSVDIYPKTSFDQVEDRPNMSEYQEKNALEQDIEELGFNKVNANPTDTGSTNLTKLKVGNTVYLIPEGTVVEGNPTESGSVDLTKLKVGNTVYNIPSGGGSGGIYLHTVNIVDNPYTYSATILILNDNNTPINTYSLLYTNTPRVIYGILENTFFYPLVSWRQDTSTDVVYLFFIGNDIDGKDFIGATFTDTVIQL